VSPKPKAAKAGPAKQITEIDSLGPLNASNADDALDALNIVTGAYKGIIYKHPEKRYKFAHAAYEERRLPEMLEEHKGGIRLGSIKQMIHKEFQKSEENPYNRVGNVRYNATKDEIALEKEAQMEEIEARLGGM